MTDQPNPAPETIDIGGLMKLLPHRYPLLLIDRVIEIVRAKRIVAIKNVTINEQFFVGHFPGYPIMPGVLIVEAMAQAGAALLFTEVTDRDDKLLVFTGIERARFRRPVTPGDQLRIEVDVLAFRGTAGRLQGKAYVDGKLACEAVVTCRLLQRPKRLSRPRRPKLHNFSMSIHPTAIVDPSAKIPASCSIGPYCIIHPGVELGENCELISNVVLGGPSRFGSNNRIYPYAVLGMDPQDITYKGEPTRLEVGSDNVIREYVTITRGTSKGGGVTRVGSHILIMAYAHIGHDCSIGDHAMLVNAATLAGHVTVEEWAVVGALCPVHQFVRIGAHSYIGGGTTITQDVLPYSMTSAERDTHAYMLNKVGLQRRGFSSERIAALHHAFKMLLASKMNTSQAIEKLRSEGAQGEDVDALLSFIESAKRGVIK
jgi:UDP-N-acetylglucosamine acyltransferase